MFASYRSKLLFLFVVFSVGNSLFAVDTPGNSSSKINVMSPRAKLCQEAMKAGACVAVAGIFNYWGIKPHSFINNQCGIAVAGAACLGMGYYANTRLKDHDVNELTKRSATLAQLACNTAGVWFVGGSYLFAMLNAKLEMVLKPVAQLIVNYKLIPSTVGIAGLAALHSWPASYWSKPTGDHAHPGIPSAPSASTDR